MELDDGISSISLPDSLEWTDEYDWSDVQQDIKQTIGGGLVISESSVLVGRPITLVGGDQVWVDKSLLDSLMAKVNVADKTFTLTLADARTFTVKFERSSNPIDAKPVWRKNVQDSDSKYTLALRLMEV